MAVTYYDWGALGWAKAQSMNTPSPYLTTLRDWLLKTYPGSQHLGTHLDRPVTGGSRPSTHAYGAAMDWGYGSNRHYADQVIAMITSNPEAFGITAIHDYAKLRMWKAGVGWVDQKLGSHGGGMNPSSTWLHFEVSPDFFDKTFQPSGYGYSPGGFTGSYSPPVTPSSQLGTGVHWGNQKLTREEIAQVAYQAGFRGEALVAMVAIAWRESAGHAQLYVNRPSTGDWSYGLWGLNVGQNMSLWSEYQAMGFTSPDELRTPLGNARAAFALYQKYGERPWGPYKGEKWTYGTDLNAARAAVDNAARTGLLGKPWQESSVPANFVTAQQAREQGPMELPPDAKLVRTWAGIFAVFDLGNGVFMHFGIPWYEPGAVNFDPNRVVNMTQAQWDKAFPNSVPSGDVRELRDVKHVYGTFKKYWESVILQTIGPHNPASKDPEVMRVLAEFAARPDMTEQELQNRLKATKYWNNMTEAQLRWNDLSEAERKAQRNDMAARMIDTVFQFTGKRVSASDPLIKNSLEDVASGKIGFGAWTESIKQQAAKDPNSPFSRMIRDEQQAQRQYGIDIENTANQIRDTLTRWGLSWDKATVDKWGRDMVDKIKSDQDLMEEIKNQAQALYPWKDREVETYTAAQPWIQTYNRLFEKAGSLETPEIQQALQASMTVWDFEQMLKKSPAWMQTQNGQQAMYDVASEINTLFGFQR